MEGRSQTAGETIAFASDLDRIEALIATCVQPLDRTRDASVSIRIEADRTPFATEGWEVLARSAMVRDGTVVLRDVCTSGFAMRMRATSTSAEFVFRRTRSQTRLLNAALPARGKLIARSALVQYPAMWWAGTRG